MSTVARGASRVCFGTALPFLYPCLDSQWVASRSYPRQKAHCSGPRPQSAHQRRYNSTTVAASDIDVDESSPHVSTEEIAKASQFDHLNPQPLDYSTTPFVDACALTVSAGAGGHGCISFLREKYIANGPANGGDGGTGGSIYIQAVRGETSLHKLARRGILKAARGRNGQGSTKGGSRGEDLLITVPVGTVVREVWRHDPIEEQDLQQRQEQGYGPDADFDADGGTDQSRKWRRDRWLLYPGALPTSFTSADFPALPRPRRSHLTLSQPPAPVRLDLDKPMETPMLLAAGAMGGLGNPHFVTKSITRPKYATKGEDGMRLHLQLELKLLADVGLVGLPNAGKSTLLRALTSSRARVGSWAFTTLAPNIGTVVLDNFRGRPMFQNLDSQGRRQEPRTSISIADIPGLIEDAHLDKGLGLGFLRHVERAAVLAFVVDLSAGDAVAALKALWREVGMYEKLRDGEVNADSERATPDEEALVAFKPLAPSSGPRDNRERDEDGNLILDPTAGRELPPLSFPPISSKPWFVVATKADLEGTQDNFSALQNYLKEVEARVQPHPSGGRNAWRRKLSAVPVSAMRKEGVEGIPQTVLELLDI